MSFPGLPTFAIVAYRSVCIFLKSLSNLASMCSVILSFFKDKPLSLVSPRLEPVYHLVY